MFLCCGKGVLSGSYVATQLLRCSELFLCCYAVARVFRVDIMLLCSC